MFKTGGITVRSAGNQGAQIDLDGVPVSRGTSLQIYAPGWKTGYYSSIGDSPRIAGKDGAVITNHRGRKVDFEATETVRSVGENKVEMVVAGKLVSDVDARVEWTIGYLNAFALYGGSVAAGGSDMLIPIFPEAPAKKDPAALVADKQSVRFTTRLGRLDVKVEKGPAELSLLDGRRAPSRWWTQDEPSLWLGMLGATIKPGEPFEFVISIEFHPKQRNLNEIPPKTVPADAQPLRQALVPQARPVQIIPKPRSLKWLDGRFPLSPETIIVADRADKRAAANIIAREAKDRFDWNWQIVEKPPGKGLPCIVVGPGTDGLRDSIIESYSIIGRAELIELSATAEPGYSYAAQTLVQMFQTDENGAFIRACDIHDAPSLNFRGVHLFIGRDSVDLYRKLAKRVLARFKFNHVVLESSYAQWDTDKQIWIKQSVPKEQLAQYVQISRDNALEPIPLVQSLGHMEWMFRNGANRELAEDPDALWAYDVTNPKTYDFIHGIYREAIDIFKPKIFHIGHDEVAIFGRYPHREKSKKLGETELFIRDVKKHAGLFGRDTLLMLWGDMLLAKGEANDQSANAPSAVEAKKRRDALDRTTMIADWHYEASEPKDYKSLKLFKDEGLRPIAATWFNPQNIYSFAQAARLYRAEGLLQTTWAGHHVTEETIARETKQFTAYVLAAEYAWSADSPRPEDLPYRAEEIFAAAMNPRRQITSTVAGSSIDLAKAADASLTNWLDVGVDLSEAQAADRIDGLAFESTQEPQAALLGGALLADRDDRPRKIKLTTNVSASELAFLHCTGFRASPGAEVGSYEIQYGDGSIERVPLIYGRDIRAWDDIGATANAPSGWFGKPAGMNAAVRVLRWANPHADKTIKSITFATEHPYASPALLGLTGLNPHP